MEWRRRMSFSVPWTRNDCSRGRLGCMSGFHARRRERFGGGISDVREPSLQDPPWWLLGRPHLMARRRTSASRVRRRSLDHENDMASTEGRCDLVLLPQSTTGAKDDVTVQRRMTRGRQPWTDVFVLPSPFSCRRCPHFAGVGFGLLREGRRSNPARIAQAGQNPSARLTSIWPVALQRASMILLGRDVLHPHERAGDQRQGGRRVWSRGDARSRGRRAEGRHVVRRSADRDGGGRGCRSRRRAGPAPRALEDAVVAQRVEQAPAQEGLSSNL
jgi:hypothetical protein